MKLVIKGGNYDLSRALSILSTCKDIEIIKTKVDMFEFKIYLKGIKKLDSDKIKEILFLLNKDQPYHGVYISKIKKEWRDFFGTI